MNGRVRDGSCFGDDANQSSNIKKVIMAYVRHGMSCIGSGSNERGHILLTLTLECFFAMT